jgi:hypothetical protein
MQFYCGIDLSSRSSQVCVVDEEISVLVQQKAPDELLRIIELIEPYKESLKTVVEAASTGTGSSMGFRSQDLTYAFPIPLGCT